MQSDCTAFSDTERQCAHCSASFTLAFRNQKYCGPACSKAVRRTKMALYQRAYRGSPMDAPLVTRPYRNRITITCLVCGTERSKPASHVRTERQFCGTVCANKASVVEKPTSTCIVCGKTFSAEGYQLARGRNVCGRACRGRLQSDGNTLERLHNKAVRLPNGCLVRTQRLMPSGYSNISWRGKSLGAHVLAYLLANGEESIPKGWDVCHTCPGGDNKACIEPTHLSIKTHAQNIQDASQRGSMPSKLNPDIVREIRRLYATGEHTLAVLAEMFSVSDMTIYSVANRRTWAWVV